jgi:peptidyl-tRNA hydrolase
MMKIHVHPRNKERCNDRRKKELGMFTAQVFHNMKQIIVINEALKAPEEKRVAQVARASVGAFLEAGKNARKTWLHEGRPKVVLNAFDEEDLQDLLSKAERRRLPIYLVGDTGQAATSTGSVACLGIGPACDTLVDELMEVLNFYRWVRENVANAKLLG